MKKLIAITWTAYFSAFIYSSPSNAVAYPEEGSPFSEVKATCTAPSKNRFAGASCKYWAAHIVDPFKSCFTKATCKYLGTNTSDSFRGCSAEATDRSLEANACALFGCCSAEVSNGETNFLCNRLEQEQINGSVDCNNETILELDLYKENNLALLLTKVLASEHEIIRPIVSSTEGCELKDELNKLNEFSQANFEDERYLQSFLNTRNSLYRVIDYIKTQALQNVDLKFFEIAHDFFTLQLVRHETKNVFLELRRRIEDNIQDLWASSKRQIMLNIPIPIIGPALNIKISLTGEARQECFTNLRCFFTDIDAKRASTKIALSMLNDNCDIGAKIAMEKAKVTLFYSLESYLDFLNKKNSWFHVGMLRTQNTSLRNTDNYRKEMQQLERENLLNSIYFESRLRILGALPSRDAYIKFVDITEAKSTENIDETTFIGAIEASAGLKASDGTGIADIEGNLRLSLTDKKYQKNVSVLSLLNDDMSAKQDLYLGKKYFENIIKEGRDMFDNYCKMADIDLKNPSSMDAEKIKKTIKLFHHELQQYIPIVLKLELMKNTKRQIQDRLKKAKEAQRPGEHSDAIAETIKEEENRLKNIETEIKEQEKHLKSLLEKIKEDKKEAIKTQSKKENIWKRLYRKFSRNNDDERGIFLKSASGMAYFFREKLVEGMQDASQKSEALLLLRHVRKDLERLEKMYLLTDNESKKSKGFVNKSATATIVEAEVAGNVQFNNQVTEFSTVYRHAEKSPILTENGEFVIVRATVPSATSGQLGRRFLETNSFKSLLSYLDKNKIEREPTDQESNSDKLADYMRVLGADVGNVISSEIGRVLSNTGGIGGSSIGGIISGGIGASSDHEWIYKIIEKPKIESDKALPIIDELIPFKKRIVIDYMLSTGKNIVKAGLGTPKFGLPIPFIGASISNANGKVEKRTGSDTLHDMFGKYNSMSLGIIDTDTPITSINLLLANQSHQLLKMFQSIGERNVQSNVLFELQEVYNNLLRLENLDSSAITELFRQFITDCVTIAPLAEAYDNAEESEKDRLAEEIGVKNNNGLLANLVRSFRDICQEQYIHIFKPYYENAFQYIFPK